MSSSSIYRKYGYAIDEVKQMEPHYILRPRHAIFVMFLRMFLLDFGICTLLSFGVLWVPMIPVWILCIFRQGIRIAYMKKFNMSPYKVLLFIAAVLAGEFAAAHYIRELLWLVISNLFNMS